MRITRVAEDADLGEVFQCTADDPYDPNGDYDVPIEHLDGAEIGDKFHCPNCGITFTIGLVQ